MLQPAFGCDKCEVVVDVIDGDTVMVMLEGKVRPLHLCSVDAPQMEQPFGPEAKQYTTDLLLNKVVTIDYIDMNRANDIVTFDGKSLKWGLIRAGLAWYPRNHEKNQLRSLNDPLGKQERKARRKRVGLWAQKDPQPPWSLHNNTESLPEVVAKLGNTSFGRASVGSGAKAIG